MFTLRKDAKKDFVILNITDTQLSDEEWAPDHLHLKIFLHTMNELLTRVNPDLITVTGDITWAQCPDAHKKFCDYMDSLGLPWAPVWGNHDCDVPEVRSGKEKVFYESENCLFEAGNPALGNGNYVIRIKEDEKTVETLIMVDSHDRAKCTHPDGEEEYCWARLYPEQINWIRDTAVAEGNECSVFLHIPIYAYRTAFDEAFRADEFDPKSVDPQDSANPKYWRISGCSGVKYEDICSFAEDDGALEAIGQAKNIKYMFCGHDHVNNFMIPYHGITLAYAMKTGPACYWNDKVSGGTVITVGERGIKDVHHEYVPWNG